MKGGLSESPCGGGEAANRLCCVSFSQADRRVAALPFGSATAKLTPALDAALPVGGHAGLAWLAAVSVSLRRDRRAARNPAGREDVMSAGSAAPVGTRSPRAARISGRQLAACVGAAAGLAVLLAAMTVIVADAWHCTGRTPKG